MEKSQSSLLRQHAVRMVGWVVTLCLFLLSSCVQQREEVNGLTRDDIPTFPWPPPKPSASADIPLHRIVSSVAQPDLGDVADSILTALEGSGYGEVSFYRAPEGFAIVTRLEQINPDGSSIDPPDRWAVQITAPRIFSVGDYIRALFVANPGRFRIIVFAITTSGAQSDSLVTREEAMEWLSLGYRFLPSSIRRMPLTESHICTALIYEFEQQTSNHDAVFRDPSNMTGRQHLEKAKLGRAIGHE